MILSFSLPQFEYLIKSGIKTFTLREDLHQRWRAGMTIHFWMGSPRNPKKNPYSFGEGICSSVEYCVISVCKNFVILAAGKNSKDRVIIKNKEELNLFAIEDGFENWDHLKEFFDEDFEGRLIRWDFNKCLFF